MTSLWQAAARQLAPPPPTIDPVSLMRAAGMDPDDWQAELLSVRPARALLCCGRQVGKSTCAAVMALHEAVTIDDSTTLMVSPSQRQSSELLSRVRSLLSQLPDPPGVANESSLQIRFTNNSRILSLPATESTVRGYSCELLLLDEAARCESALIDAVKPMLAATGGRMIAMSTPYGRQGWFAESWFGDGTWHRTEVRADQCPRISPAFLAQEKATLPAAVYQSEYEAVFTDAVDAVFRAEDVDACFTDEVQPL